MEKSQSHNNARQLILLFFAFLLFIFMLNMFMYLLMFIYDTKDMHNWMNEYVYWKDDVDNVRINTYRKVVVMNCYYSAPMQNLA